MAARGGTPLAGTPSLLRSMNARAVLECISGAGAIARGDIASATGLSKQTITLALGTLLESGVVVESGRVQGRTGPAAVQYTVDPRCGFAVGVDIGAQYVRVAVADIAGTVLADTTGRTRQRTATLVEQVRQFTARVAEQAGVRLDEVVHTVVGLPAAIRPDGETLLLGDTLPRAGEGLVPLLRTEIPTPVTVENDINLAALGELAAGHGRTVDDFVFLSLGTGPGLGIVIDGRLRRGSSGVAGEIGQIPGEDWSDGLPEPGRRIDMDRLLSSTTIVAEARQAGLPAGSTPRDVFAAARSGDAAARSVVSRLARRTAQLIAAITPLVDPQLVVLGGGIGRNGDLLNGHIEDCLRRAATFAPRVVTTQLGDRAVLVGATEAARTRAREAAFRAATGVGRATIDH